MRESTTQTSSGGIKPPSFDSRIESLKDALAVLDSAVHQLVEAMLVEAPTKRRTKLLAINAALGHDGQAEMFETPDGE